MMDHEALWKFVRELTVSLPETAETVDGFGDTVFRVQGRPFIRLSGHGRGTQLSFKSSKEQQELLIQEERFYRTPYIGRFGWVSLQTDSEWEASDMADLLRDAYSYAAPQRILRELESRQR